MSSRFHIFALMLLSLPAFGSSKVLKLSKTGVIAVISQDAANPWTEGDRACAIREKKVLSCGPVLKATAKGAVMGFEVAADVKPGDLILRSRRTPASLPDGSSEAEVTRKPKERGQALQIALGGNIGTSFAYPTLRLGLALGQHFSLAVSPLFFSAADGEDSVSIFGGLLSANYCTKTAFQGFWFQAAAGLNYYGFKLSGTAGSRQGISAVGTVGYRLGLGAFNVGLGVGAQYAGNPNLVGVNLTSIGFKPMATLDLGLAF